MTSNSLATKRKSRFAVARAREGSHHTSRPVRDDERHARGLEGADVQTSFRYARCMRFDEKARENLDAALRLLPDETGAVDALPNASASRAYYAVYFAIADCAQQRQREFTDDENEYYRHNRLPDDALAWGILDHDRCDDLRLLHGRRIKADYWEDQVSLEEASDSVDIATSLLDVLLAETA